MGVVKIETGNVARTPERESAPLGSNLYYFNLDKGRARRAASPPQPL